MKKQTQEKFMRFEFSDSTENSYLEDHNLKTVKVIELLDSTYERNFLLADRLTRKILCQEVK
jgi:hypothetical protein